MLPLSVPPRGQVTTTELLLDFTESENLITSVACNLENFGKQPTVVNLALSKTSSMLGFPPLGDFTESENFVTSYACNLETKTPHPVSFITNSVCNLGKPNIEDVLERARLTTYGCLPKVSGFPPLGETMKVKT